MPGDRSGRSVAGGEGTLIDMADLFGVSAEPSPELRRAIAALRHAYAEPPEWLLDVILERLDATDRSFLTPMGRIAAYAGGIAAGAAGAFVIANRARIRELIS